MFPDIPDGRSESIKAHIRVRGVIALRWSRYNRSQCIQRRASCGSVFGLSRNHVRGLRANPIDVLNV
jgi:hypothetical protein